MPFANFGSQFSGMVVMIGIGLASAGAGGAGLGNVVMNVQLIQRLMMRRRNANY
jgi:hypothetical protein